jgi:hypothetical protein
MPVSSAPAIATVPLVGVSRPARQCSSVDFPDPDGPMIAANSPRRNVASTPSSATTLVVPSPYTFVNPTAATAASAGASRTLVISVTTLPSAGPAVRRSGRCRAVRLGGDGRRPGRCRASA